MRSIRFTIAAFVLAAFTIISAQAQTRPATQPPAGGGVAPTTGGTGRFAIIDSSEFSDDKTGITRVVNAMKQLDTQFEPQRADLRRLTDQYNALVADIQKKQQIQDPKVTQQQQDQAEQLQLQIKRKQEDAQAAFQKRSTEVLDPLQQDVGNALTAYAQARGIAIIIDVSRVPVIYADNNTDITKDFIAEYNRTHPATAAAATPANHPE
jgi:Skp family chaperone for outer membrane proteins